MGLLISVFLFAASAVLAAPYASMVMDARSGEVLYSRNADTRLHPASLTKMMTLYIAFEAVKHGEISLDTEVRISRHAASEPPSKLGLKEGQKIALRYLIRAAAVKSANDAATAIGEAIAGSEAAFARRMNRTAKALGMTRTTFRNAHGLTEEGHLSTARDMTILGRHLLYDYPQYYNIFSRKTTDAGGRMVYNTNRKFLSAYKGADGIKTGYTRAAGFNLVASAERGNERVIATIFGGQSTASRNAHMAELLDIGFRKAPSRVALRVPPPPQYDGMEDQPGGSGKTLRVSGTVQSSPRPKARPVPALPEPSEDVLIALQEGISSALAEVDLENTAEAEVAPANPVEPPDVAEALAEAAVEEEALPVEAEEVVAVADAPAVSLPRIAPRPRPGDVVLASAGTAAPSPAPVVREAEREVVTRLSTSGGRHWGINVGRFTTRTQAEKVLLQTALMELSTLDDALRKVVRTPQGFDANFVGMSEEKAALACRRLSARSLPCATIGPG